MRALLPVFALALAACGLGVIGLATEGADGGTDAASPPAPDVDAAPRDGATPLDDAGVDAPADAGSPPDPTKVLESYAIGKNAIVYRFDVTTTTFTALPSVGCPVGEETAVLTDGRVYVTSSTNLSIYRLTPTGCALLKSGSTVPYALGTAPAGTVSATEETLVGYSGADYVRVNETTGDVTMIGAGALGALRPSGDLTAIGKKGYLAAASGLGSCPAGGDCVVEVDLLTGAPVQVVQQLVGFSIYGIAHSKGVLLLYANGALYPYDVGAKALGAALSSFPTGASFSGAGAPPFP